ncbi:phytoene/squalene synthase family protein [Luteimonas sp. RIT-PG2_3]
MNDSTALETFVDKWRTQWPEWGVAAVFVPVGQRPQVGAWFALLQELLLAAWTGQEAAPGLAKLAWWQDELQGWAKGGRRHPLGEVLQKHPAPWGALALALNGMPATRESMATDPAAATEVLPLARAILGCEAVLFGGAASVDAQAVEERAVDERAVDERAVIADLLAERALLAGDLETTRRLLQLPPPRVGRTRPRRMQAAILRGRLAQLQRGRPGTPVPAWRSLMGAWRAARQG